MSVMEWNTNCQQQDLILDLFLEIWTSQTHQPPPVFIPQIQRSINQNYSALQHFNKVNIFSQSVPRCPEQMHILHI